MQFFSSAIDTLQTLVAVSYTHLDVYKRQDMNRANEVRPIFRSLGDIAQATGCAIVLIGHLNKATGTQSTYRGLGSIDITAAVRSLLFIGKLKDSPTTRVLILSLIHI